MEITVKVALEVATHEALIRQAYLDSEDVWTWSVGLTSQTGHKVTRYINHPQTLEHCLRIWLWALDNYAEAVRSEFRDVDLEEHQFAAALSFHWNTGGIKSALWPDAWKAGRIAEAREAFMSWRKPESIIPRREKERDLFFEGAWSQDGMITEWTRLTASKRPDWKSGKRIDIVPAVKAILGTAPVDVEPIPVPTAPDKLARIAPLVEQIRSIILEP